MSGKIKSTFVILSLLLLFSMTLVMGIRLVFPFHCNAVQTTEKAEVSSSSPSNLQTAHPNEVKNVSAITAQPEESSQIKPTGIDEKDDEIKLKRQQEREQYLLKQQHKRLQMIEEKAGQKRQQIEADYLRKCRELQTRTEAMIRSLNSQEKIAWVKLNQELKHITTTTKKSTIAVGYTTPDDYTVGYSISDKVSESNVVNNPAQEYAVEQQQITEKENDILKSYKQELLHFQRWREYELAKVEKLEKRSKIYVSSSIRSITKKAKPETPGLVTGIMFSKDKPSILFSNNRRIVYEGDTIYGVTIVKIHKDEVEFTKNGQRWTQKVGETPSQQW